MKNKCFIFAFVGVVTGAVLTTLIGCNVDREKKVEDAKENVKEANQELKDAQAQYEKDWQQFKSDAESKISTNIKSIDTLKLEMKKASLKFKAKYGKEVKGLEQKNIELKKKIIEYKYDGKDKWEEFKQGFNQDIDIVGKAIKDIFAKKNKL